MVIYDSCSGRLGFFRVICNDKHSLHGREMRRYTAFTLSDGFFYIERHFRRFGAVRLF